MPDSSELLSNIVHYQKSLDKYSQSRNDTKILHCIFKLFNMPVTVSHLEKTGIGRTVNALRKLGGEVGDAANTLVKKWKDMVSRKSDGEDNANESESQYESQNYRNESNSSHTHSDKAKNNDRTEKLDKNDKHKNYKRDRYDELKQQSTSERKKSDKRSKESKSKSSFDSEDIDSEPGVSFDSDHSSSAAENIEDRRQEHKYIKHKESSSERSSKHRRDTDKDTKQEKSLSKESKKQDSHLENERKRRRLNSSSSDSNEQISRHSSSTTNKSNNKRKYENSSSDEESKNKISKRSSSHKSSKESSRQEHKSRSELDMEISTHDHQKSNYKIKESSSKQHKKENKGESHKKEHKSSSKNDSKSERRNEESSKEGRSKSDDKSNKEHTKKDRKSDSKDKLKNKSSKSSNSTGSTSTNTSSSNKIVDIYSESGTSFAEALGMLEPTTSKISTKKMKTSETNHKLEKSVLERNSKEKSVSEKIVKVDKIDIIIPPPPPKTDIDLNIASLLPPITPNYRPIANPFVDNCITRNKIINDDEALNMVMSQKNQRTKVFSGNKCFYGTVPTLFELCIRILQDNIDALEYTGGVPYSILKPILDKATPDQLFTLEHHNPYLIDDSDEIWQFHCQKEFRNKKREEMESWREMYMRCLDEREAKLKALTENIKLSQDKSIPVRQTKLAYVDSVVKPPRDVLRKQAKSGIDKKPVVTPSSRLNALATSGAANQVSVPNPVKPSGGSSAAMKPKKAPLMQKTLAFIKGSRFRR